MTHLKDGLELGILGKLTADSTATANLLLLLAQIQTCLTPDAWLFNILFC